MVAPYVEHAKVTYPVVVDVNNILAKRLGLSLVPNGVMVNPAGRITMIHEGGFNVAVHGHRQTVVELVTEQRETAAMPDSRRSYELTAAQEEQVAELYDAGLQLLQEGEALQALRTWRSALLVDPDNYIIRKQCWYLEHPEKFEPTVDYDWQKKQLALEHRAEAEERAEDSNRKPR